MDTMRARFVPSPSLLDPPSSTITLTHDDDRQVKLRDGYDVMHQTILKSMNAYAVVLSLLLASSFAGFSQFPNPANDTKSSIWQKIFTYFSGASFISSVTGLLFFASSSFSPLLALDTSGLLSIEKEVDKKLQLLANTLPKFLYLIFFFGVALTSCILAYIFAGLSAFPHKISEQLPVILPGAIGVLIYAQALWIVCTDTFQLVRVSVRQNEKLWTAVKKGTLFGMLLVHYVDFLCRHLQVTDGGTSLPPLHRLPIHTPLS